MKTSPKIIAALAIPVFIYGCTTETVLSIFSGFNDQAANLHTIQTSNPQPLTVANTKFELPARFSSEGKLEKTENFLTLAGTAGMVVTHNDEIVYEDYFRDYDKNVLFSSWSVAKSYISALIGIAIREGDISSVDDLVSAYVPELNNTPYANVTIEQVLEMGSGVAFDETYSSLNSDAVKLMSSLKEDVLAEVLTYQNIDHQPGEYNAYKSIDSQVLGLVLNRATNKTTAEYAEQFLWQPAGMESDGQWLADQNNQEGTFCCLNTTTRDMNRFGLIYLNNGFYNGQQIIPQQWVEQSLDTSKPYLQPGENDLSRNTWGWGYHWWVPGFDNDYAAVGVFNQYIYVMPDEQVVISKHSAPGTYYINNRGTGHIDLFRVIGKTLERDYMQIVNHDNGACLVAVHGLLTSHSEVKHKDCEGRLREYWHYDEATQQLINRDGGCLDAGDNPQQDDRLKVKACNDSDAQKFVLSEDTIQPASAAGLNVDAFLHWIHGDAVGLWSAHQDDNQKWRFIAQ